MKLGSSLSSRQGAAHLFETPDGMHPELLPHLDRIGHGIQIPLRRPERPNMHELQHNGRRFPPNHLHESWLDFLYWDVELEA